MSTVAAVDRNKLECDIWMVFSTHSWTGFKFRYFLHFCISISISISFSIAISAFRITRINHCDHFKASYSRIITTLRKKSFFNFFFLNFDVLYYSRPVWTMKSNVMNLCLWFVFNYGNLSGSLYNVGSKKKNKTDSRVNVWMSLMQTQAHVAMIKS